MTRLSLLSGLLAVSVLGVVGCGGDKSDFSARPVKYSIQNVSPLLADGVVVAGVSRDGRVIGTYLKSAAKTVFGWNPDGTTADITPPIECKELGGINELGGVLGADRGVVPNKLFRWQGETVDPIKVPAGAVVDSFAVLTYDALFLVNLHVGNGKTRGYQLSIDEDPKVFTTDDGALTGSSLSGDFVGYDKQGTLTHGIAVIDDKKLNMGLFGGKPTIPYSINDNGTAVGASHPQTANSRAFRWSKGAYANLAGPAGATATVAYDINDGNVIGGEATINGVPEACIWFPKGGATLVKSLVTVPAGTHLERVKLVTPLGIVICEGTRTTGAVTRKVVLALFPEFA